MAITSISRIQQRRGKKNSGTGLPQLASGELGWAIDSQELFIGNGSVAEGAPSVGNTRILTEYDLTSFQGSSNIFTQLNYVYKSSREIIDYTFSTGSGYTEGKYDNLTLTLVSGLAPISYPVVNVEVNSLGQVGSVNLIFPGSGVYLNSIFTTSIGIGGSGFELNVNSISNSTPVIEHTVERTIQDRLDDQVITANFGSVGNGTADDTFALQNAIYELYTKTPSATTDSRRRVILEIPPGTFKISDSLRIPSHATIVGAGKHNTTIVFNPTVNLTGSIITGSLNVIHTSAAHPYMIGATVSGSGLSGTVTVTDALVGQLVLSSSGTVTSNASYVLTLLSNKPVIEFIDDTAAVPDIASTTFVTQPKHITLKDLSISSTIPAQLGIKMNSVRDSLFDNISVSGNWGELIDENSVGIKLEAVSSLVTCDGNLFRNVSIDGFNYGVYSDHDIVNNKFRDGFITNTLHGFAFGISTNGTSFGQEFGPSNSLITGYKFSDVKHQAVNIVTGFYNTVADCTLVNVGNDGGTVGLLPQIIFKSANNKLGTIITDRPLESYSTPDVTYVPEFSGIGEFDLYGTLSVTTSVTASASISASIMVAGVACVIESNPDNTNFVLVGAKNNNLGTAFITSGPIIGSTATVVAFPSTPLFTLPMPLIPTPPAITPPITYNIEYTYSSTTLSVLRKGVLSITYNGSSDSLIVTDDYNYTGGNDAVDFVTCLVLSAEVNLLNNLVVYYRNSPINKTVDDGIFTYFYSALS